MFIGVLFIIAKLVHQLSNTQSWVYPYNGELFIHKNKGGSDACYNMNKSWKYYAESKKLD